MIGRCLGQLSHPPAPRGAPLGRLPASARRPVGIWGVIGRKKPIGGHMEILRSPSERRTVTQGCSAVNLDMESHPTVSAGRPLDHRWIIAGSSLDMLILSAVISIWRDLWDVKQQWVIKIKSFII